MQEPVLDAVGEGGREGGSHTQSWRNSEESR